MELALKNCHYLLVYMELFLNKNFLHEFRKYGYPGHSLYNVIWAILISHDCITTFQMQEETLLKNSLEISEMISRAFDYVK